MATSGSKTITAYTTSSGAVAGQLKFSWTEDSQSIANNTTTIKWTLQLISLAYGAINSSASKSYKVVVNGTEYEGTNTIGIGNNATKTLASGTTTIAHNSDGTKAFSYSFSQTFGITYGGKSVGTKSGSGSGTLDTIPRKSTLTVDDGTLGTAQTLTISEKASAFVHKIQYECGDASGWVLGSSSATSTSLSVSWTAPLSLASENTIGTSVLIKFTLYTYNGTTLIGSNAYTQTYTIPASVKPSCAVTVTDPMGYEDIYGNPIKGLSKFKVVVTPTTAYGSAIASYNVNANGATYTSSSFTTGVLKSSGAVSVSATVKDKRGRTASASASKTVLNYIDPVVAVLTVNRCNEDGVDNEQGEYVKVNFEADVTPLNNQNTATYTLYYKKSAETDFTEVGLDEFENNFSVNSSYVFPADTSSSYDIEFTVTDNFKTTTRATNASTGFAIMHFKSDGTGIGLGKLCEDSNTLDVGLGAVFREPVYGKVMGLDRLPAIPSNSNLNDYMETGCYAVHSNAIAETVANIPVARAGRLEVISATGEGIRVTQWSYLRQKYTPYNADNAVWERDITRSADNVWRFYDWYRSSLTKSKSEEIYHGQKVLWGADMASGMYMTNGHTANLAEKVSEQPNGIVLVFCYYNGTSDTNWGWQSFFVPKQLVALETGEGFTFTLNNGKFGSVGTKYLYINNDSVVGHADNNLTGTGSGITYANNKFVLRYIIGV